MRKIIIGSVLAFAISMNLLFVNCSGPHVVGIDLMSGAGEVSLSGTWHSNLCAPLTAGKSARDVFVFQSLNSDVVAIKKGHLEYANTTCSGAGTLVAALSDMGTLEIKNRETYAGKTFYRTDWVGTPFGTSPTIWAFKTTKTLCSFADSDPTIFPTVQDLYNYLSIIDEVTCYTLK